MGDGQDVKAWERVRRIASLPPHQPNIPGAPKPTADDLKRHAERFGADAVGDTARELGVTVEVHGAPGATKARRPRRRKR